MDTSEIAMMLWELEHSVLDELPVCVALVGRDGVFRLANQQLADLLGCERGEIVGSPRAAVLGPHVCLALSRYVARVLRGERVIVAGRMPYRTGARRMLGVLSPASKAHGCGYWAVFYAA